MLGRIELESLSRLRALGRNLMFAGFFCVKTLTGNVQTRQDENPE